MELKDVKSYEGLEVFLREFSSHLSTESGTYDLVGVIHLWLALLDNLQMNGVQTDAEAIAISMTPKQGEFLFGLAERVKSVTGRPR